MALQEYNFDIKYWSGVEHRNADVLSRIQDLHDGNLYPVALTSDRKYMMALGLMALADKLDIAERIISWQNAGLTLGKVID